MLLQVPNCTSVTSEQLSAGALITLVNSSIDSPSVSITFLLPTDIMTEVTVTLTDIKEVDLVFENIQISK